MNDPLPPSWVRIPLGKICLPVSHRGRSDERKSFCYVDLGAIDNATKQIREPGHVRVSEAPSRAKQILRAGDVLFSNVRVYLENIALVPNELDGEIASTAFCVLRPAQGIDPRFLYRFVSSRQFVLAVNALQRGNSPPAVQDRDILSQELPLAPEQEQVRIASRIDELFSEIEEGERALERVQKLVARYRQSVLKAAVTGELTRDWREKHKGPLESGEALLQRILKVRREASDANKYCEPALLDVAELPDLPQGWAWASVEQLCSEFGNGLSRKPADKPPGIPILRISAVRSMRVNSADIRYYVPERSESLESFQVQSGDLLFTRYNGSKELVGVSGVYRGVDPVLHPDKLIKARVVSIDHVIPEYLALSLNCGESWRHITGWVKTSAGQHGIAGSDIKRTPIPLPPFVEQREIVDVVERAALKCDEVLNACSAELRRASAFRQSTLKFAFSGKLVEQDPMDECASALLERIAAESMPSAITRTRSRRQRRTA